MENLVCSECGTEYRMSPNGRMRGAGSFCCEVCGQDIFLWDCTENIDYDFEMIRGQQNLSNSN